ncbi:MAG: hypothetical protein Q7R66_21000 [Undibacterium sp.]|uniref:hypothetical protein n=1 Tax=Undibacterium sp. TaxID=1914977 RepID=UPI0027224117|nr:hypothetical protein [Undibacterium sp.]MDO8654657.1 hypothetical protein [Undibacterium sp.]
MNISLIRRLRPFQMGALTLTSLLFVLGLSLPIPFGWYSPEMSARVVMPGGAPVAGAIVVSVGTLLAPGTVLR